MTVSAGDVGKDKLLELTCSYLHDDGSVSYPEQASI
jgi:hypothetical protein